jgi:glycine/D-amino acid oxidase-like deaminating enzyme
VKEKANVVIIGGGIIGSSLAYSLTRRISGIVVVERDGIGSQASGSNYGMVWLQNRLAGFDLMLTRRSLEMYEELTSEVFDMDIEFEKKGGMTVFRTLEQKTVMERIVQEKQKLGVPLRMVDALEAHDLEPALAPEIIGATYSPEEAQLNPILTTLAFARAAQRQGAIFRIGTEVTGIRTEKGRVTGVLTSQGEIEAPLVVNAAGAWARRVAEMASLQLPVFPQRLQSLVTEPLAQRLLQRVVQAGRMVSQDEIDHPEKVLSFSVRCSFDADEKSLPVSPLEDSIFSFLKPTRSGNMVIGTTSEFVGHDKGVLPKALSLMMQRAVEIVPRLREVSIIRTWANFVPFTFDTIPVMGWVPELEGFLIATGHAHGMAHAPATAEALADLIVNNQPSFPLEEASPLRFRQ